MNNEKILNEIKYCKNVSSIMSRYKNVHDIDIKLIIGEYTKFLNEHYIHASIGQRIYHIKNDIYQIVMCNMCKSNPARYHTQRKYTTCGELCNRKSISENSQNKLIEKYENDTDFLDNSIEKMKATTRNDRNGLWSNQTKIGKERRTKTCISRYGVDHNMKTNEAIKRMKEDNPARTEHSKAKFRKLMMEKFKSNLDKRYELIDYNEISVCLFDKVHNKNFVIHKQTLVSRRSRNHVISTIENPIRKGYSIGEKQLSSYIKTIYGGKILENDRKLLKPYNIDIIIPDLKICIEYYGDYWHANPLSYKKTDIVKYANKEILIENLWIYDEKKRLFCENKGYKFIVVWENDWLNNQSEVESLLFTLL